MTQTTAAKRTRKTAAQKRAEPTIKFRVYFTRSLNSNRDTREVRAEDADKAIVKVREMFPKETVYVKKVRALA